MEKLEDLIFLLQKSTSSDANVLYALKQLQSLSTQNQINKETICAKKAIPIIVQWMDESKKTFIREAVVRLLRSLSVVECNQIEMFKCKDICNQLISIVKDVELPFQVNAAAILFNLTASETNRKKMVSEQFSTKMIDVLEETAHDGVRHEIVGALCNLSNDGDHVQLMIRHGIVSLLNSILSPGSPCSKKTQRLATMCLHRCVSHPSGYGMLNAQTLDILQKAMDEFDLEEEMAPKDNVEEPPLVTLNNTDMLGTMNWNSIELCCFCSSPQNGGAYSNTVACCEVCKKPGGVCNRFEKCNCEKEEEQCGCGDSICIGCGGRGVCQLGKGAFSVVYGARINGHPVAVKILNESLPDDYKRRSKMLLEHKIMSQLRHPNCLTYMGSALTPKNQLAIISEYCSRGDLRHNLNTVTSMPQRLKFAKDIIAGMNWMHANNIIHRDLKPQNILISSNWSARISDFGLSLVWRESCVCVKFKGNVKYAAPELLRVRVAQSTGKGREEEEIYPYGPQTDVYSFGLMLWELVSKMTLFDGIKGKDGISDFVCNDGRPPLNLGWPGSLTALLKKSWHPDPKQRILFPQIQSLFSNIMIDVLCPDPIGRRIARDLWFNDELRWVPYVDFEKAVGRHLQIDFDQQKESYRRCLQVMVCNPHTNVVSLEAWCNCIHWIGSMTNPGSLSSFTNTQVVFLEKIVKLFQQPWFFGFLQSRDAKRLLVEHQRLHPSVQGFYLIRFSDNYPGAYSIYSIDRAGRTSHRKIAHQYEDIYSVTLDGVEGSQFSDLYCLHQKCCEMGTCLLGMTPLPGAPYQCFFTNSVSISSNGSNVNRRERDVKKDSMNRIVF